MFSRDIDWQSGLVTFWDLDFLDPTVPVLAQLSGLKEDLAQISYGGQIALDVGWYPEFSEAGAFVVRVVRIDDWETPLFIEEHRSVQELAHSMSRAARVAEAAWEI